MRNKVDALAMELNALLPENLENVHFVCVGSDRSTGDSLGPLVGRYLKRRGIKNVHGTLDDPCHALNLHEVIAETEGKFVIGIDACLGLQKSVGEIRCQNKPLRPGEGVGKDLPLVGDISIKGIVNIGGYMEYFVLQNTRLSIVDEMATIIGRAICKVFKDRTMKNALLQVAAGGES